MCGLNFEFDKYCRDLTEEAQKSTLSEIKNEENAQLTLPKKIFFNGVKTLLPIVSLCAVAIGHTIKSGGWDSGRPDNCKMDAHDLTESAIPLAAPRQDLAFTRFDFNEFRHEGIAERAFEKKIAWPDLSSLFQRCLRTYSIAEQRRQMKRAVRISQ